MKKNDSLIGKSLSDYQNSKRSNQIVITTLSVALCVTSFMALRNNTEVVVTPANFDKEITVRGSRANEAYMTGHALSIAGLAGNLNERNVDFVVNTLSRMMTPYLRTNLEEALMQEAQILKIRKATQSFVIEDMMYEPRNNLVWVWGTKTLQVSTGTTHNQRWTYELRIEPHAGMPRITHFDAYSGVPKKKTDDYVVEANPYMNTELAEALKTTNPDNTRFKLPLPAEKPTPSTPSGSNEEIN